MIKHKFVRTFSGSSLHHEIPWRQPYTKPIFHNTVGVTDLLELNLRQLQQETLNIIRYCNGKGDAIVGPNIALCPSGANDYRT